MRVLVIGSGGREHALAWKLRQSPQVNELLIAPGNGGTAVLGENVPVKADDIEGLVNLARQRQVDFTVVGPEQPLSFGLVDAFNRAGLLAFGPVQNAARLESSKSFSKDFMAKYHIPTAAYQTFTSYESAAAYVESLSEPPVIKADGLAAGKGVIISASREEALTALRQILVEKEFGASGNAVVIEEHLSGQEVSLLALSDGHNYLSFLPAQDHKAIYDGDCGPNTGGMGAYAPAPIFNANLQDQAKRTILGPTVSGLAGESIDYRGVIYAGLMLTPDGAKVLEYNCRFGDPETQVLMPMLQDDLAVLLKQCALGQLPAQPLQWHTGACVCVVLASGGYPGKYRSGYPISGIAEAESLGCVVFHAGTKLENDQLLTAGGRVLGVTATGSDLAQAIERAYAGVRCIHFQDMYYRKDIGAKGLAFQVK